MDIKYEDLYDAAAVVGTEQPLIGRLDSAVTGVTSTADDPRRATGLMGRCANTGYLIGRLAGKTVFTMDLAIMNALTDFAALDLEIPPGQTLSLYEQSSAGVALCSVTVRHERQG